MEQILDIYGNPIVLDKAGNQVLTEKVIDTKEQLDEETTEDIEAEDTPEAKATRKRRPKQKITSEFITLILQDKYHNSMTVSEIKNKHGIGHDAYKFINSHSDIFIEKFGKKKKKVTQGELQEYWNSLKI